MVRNDSSLKRILEHLIAQGIWQLLWWGGGALITSILPSIFLNIQLWQKVLLTIGLFIILFGIILFILCRRDVKRAENERLIKSIPSLLTATDVRRGELIQSELDKRMGSGNTQFVFDMLKDTWVILVGDELPELPAQTGNEDIVETLGILLNYASEAGKGIGKMQKRVAKLGEIETGLLVARKANEYLGIDDKLTRYDRSNKKLIKKLKSAREHLPSGVAVETTKAIDNYLNFSRAYRAVDVAIVPLAQMMKKIDLLKDIPITAQIIDRFQRYREQYSEQMNINLAKVNEALKQL